MVEQSESPSPAGMSLRAGIIETVKTPLGFFALGLLVFEAVFGIVAAFSQGGERTFAMISMLTGVAIIVILVAFFAYHRPEALIGSRYHPPSATPAPSQPKQEELDAARNRIAELTGELEGLHSLRLQVLAVLGAESSNPTAVAHQLGVYSDPNERARLMSVVGRLAEDGLIEPDRIKPAGYYRMVRRTKIDDA